MARKPVYSIDSSALIHAWRRAYRPKNFGFVWDGFDSLIEEKRLCASVEVYNELEKKDDELFAWCKERKETLFRELDEATQEIVRDILRNHPRLVDTVKGQFRRGPVCHCASRNDQPIHGRADAREPRESQDTRRM